MKTHEEFRQLRTLARQLPKGLVSDWKGTNHFELQATGGEVEYFWLPVRGIADDPSDDKLGERLGLVMDIVAEVGRLKDEGIL